MLLLVDKIKKLKIGWNETPLTESDFYRLCRRQRIGITEMPLRVGGFYYRVIGRDFIAIDSRLSGYQKLAVMFHELGHFLFHVPESGVTANFHRVGHETRPEREADVFALCSLIPKWLIDKNNPQDLIDEGFPAEMVQKRLFIRERYGL
ncbi:MAG: ImmA/IrrE family metallo-endopeptidase [Pyrinomonadaceae bacterium]